MISEVDGITLNKRQLHFPFIDQPDIFCRGPCRLGRHIHTRNLRIPDSCHDFAKGIMRSAWPTGGQYHFEFLREHSGVNSGRKQDADPNHDDPFHEYSPLPLTPPEAPALSPPPACPALGLLIARH